jgi:flagellar hook protein FlgE
MNSISSIAQSGMSAAVNRLSAAGNNIANSQTPGYRRQSIRQDSLPGGGVATQVQVAEQPGEDLAADIVDQMVAAYSFKANLGVIQTEQQMLGALLDRHA